MDDDKSKSLAIAQERMNPLTQQPQQKFNVSNNSNSKGSGAAEQQSSSSRRVSMDPMVSILGGGNLQQTTPHMIATSPVRRGNGSERVTIDDCSPSIPTSSSNNDSSLSSSSSNMGPMIPPVTGGGFARRSSAPGFYSTQGPLPPFPPSPHLSGMNNFLPFPTCMPPSSRRSSYAGGFLNNNHMQFPGPFSLGGMMIPSMDGFPALPFPNTVPPSIMMIMGGGGGGGRNDSTPSPSMDGSGRGDDMMDFSSRSSRRGSLGSMSLGDKSIRRPRPNGVSSFPMKLHRILSDNNYSDFVAWLPHGRAWRILKQKTFEKEVIPKFFRSARYASFMRQVNGWGFKRITEGTDLNAYYHESFLRGLPELSAEMRRPAKGAGIKGQKKVKDEVPPNFELINEIAPLPPASTTCKQTPIPPTNKPAPRPALTPRSRPPGVAKVPPRPPPPPVATITTGFPTVDPRRPIAMRDDGYRFVEPAEDDDNFLKALAPPRNQYQPQPDHDQHNREPSRRQTPMTPTPRDDNEISAAQAAFLTYTPMAEVASVSSDFDNERDYWGESPFTSPFIASGAAPTTSTAAEQCKPQVIPSASGDELLSVPSEVKIMSNGESLRNSPDKDFLTKADLTYLEHQNKLLLEQSGMFLQRRDHHCHTSCSDPFEEDPLDDDDDEGQHPQHQQDLGQMEEYNHSSDA